MELLPLCGPEPARRKQGADPQGRERVSGWPLQPAREVGDGKDTWGRLGLQAATASELREVVLLEQLKPSGSHTWWWWWKGLADLGGPPPPK